MYVKRRFSDSKYAVSKLYTFSILNNYTRYLAEDRFRSILLQLSSIF